MTGVGIVGCGAISKLHIKSFEEIEDVSLKAVSDVNREIGIKTAEKYGVDYYENYQNLLLREDIDIVSICTPSGLHYDVAVKAAKAGKHLIIEKPIGISLEKIDTMIEACRENRVKLGAIFNNRYREGNVLVKKALDEGRFGRLININVNVRWYRNPDYYLKSSWKGTWALDGGGALMNQSIHYIDLLLWFAGKIKSVFAYTETLLHRTIETEDTAVGVFKTQSGALGSIVSGTSIYPGFPAQIQITGEMGTVSVSDGIINVWSFKDKNPIDKEAELYMKGSVDNERASDPMAFDNTYHKKQIIEIVEAVRNKQEPEVNGEEARKSVELILALYKSARIKKEVIL